MKKILVLVALVSMSTGLFGGVNADGQSGAVDKGATSLLTFDYPDQSCHGCNLP